jgi:hypothetical protein
MKHRKRPLRATLENLSKVGNDAVMACGCCGATYSANPSDYFMINNPRHAFKCCGEVCVLVTKRVVWSAA